MIFEIIFILLALYFIIKYIELIKLCSRNVQDTNSANTTVFSLSNIFLSLCLIFGFIWIIIDSTCSIYKNTFYN